MLDTVNKKLFHPVRITIIYIMIIHKVDSFKGFKDYMNITGGNLASHLRTLERAGLIIITRKVADNKFTTEYKLSVHGAKEFRKMMADMELMQEGIDEVGW